MRRGFDPRRTRMGNGEGAKMRNLVVFTIHLIRLTKLSCLRWAGYVVKILTCKPAGKIPLRKPSPRWEDNIRMELK